MSPAKSKSSFLDKVLGRIGQLDRDGLQTVIQRLARERSFLETLFNTIEDGVLVVDEHGRILYLNQAVTDLLGTPLDSAEGQPISRFLPMLNWDELAAMDVKGGATVTRHEFEISYPRPRFLSLYAAPLDGIAAGGSGLALILHDATEAREKTATAIENERVQALTLLAASVAHEIGNPLNALHIHLQLMERELRKLNAELRRAEPGLPDQPGKHGSRPDRAELEEVSHKLQKYLGVAKGEITRLDYIVTQFLQAIRPVPPRLELASLNDVVKATIDLLRPEMENRGLTVRADLTPRLPLAPIDPSQIKQALVNLVKNSIQAMTKGGFLTFRTYRAQEGVAVSIADTGSGIAPEQLKHIFEPFFTTKKKGTGLGLMIVQRIVREHGGRIELESHFKRGTTFRIWLPLHGRSPRLLQAGEAASDTEESQDGHPNLHLA